MVIICSEDKSVTQCDTLIAAQLLPNSRPLYARQWRGMKVMQDIAALLLLCDCSRADIYDRGATGI